MTNEQLTRAQEIKNDLETLKSALSQLNKASIFSCDDTVTCYGRKGDAFLSELHISLKSFGVKALTKKIQELEREFKNL